MLVGFVLKEIENKFYIYYLAGYQVSGQPNIRPVSGKIIDRISGKISTRYNLSLNYPRPSHIDNPKAWYAAF